MYKFENSMAEICTKRDGVIILIGDMSFDLIAQEKESIKQYEELLSSYNQFQHAKDPRQSNIQIKAK